MNREEWRSLHGILRKGGQLSAAAEVIRELAAYRRIGHHRPVRAYDPEALLALADDVEEWADYLFDEAAVIIRLQGADQ